ncbi:hypothetical protein [Phocaeicola plebeius]|uniref:hypothetical protein n=1 Tax=Phocaeicola plebeius TaxID=310297 RepID=UPI00195854D8|nr:hypothetical protein [Phocaeicola plebeius]MBM6845390.1 hypothetical protein [Phocaeicola plebeius]
MNSEKKNALIQIYQSKQGYINRLEENISKDLIREFISVGFIICGFTRTAKTWRLSKLGHDYIQEMNLVK